MNDAKDKRRGWSWWYLLFVVQFVAVCGRRSTTASSPPGSGIPFFYWYQMLWVLISAVFTAVVYFADPGRSATYADAQGISCRV